MAGGERDLDRLLAALDADIDGERYAFETASSLALGDGDFALIREAEGVGVIRAAEDGQWARISLGVHSSLEAVGLTAQLSARLAKAGIPANIVAGLSHDHIFVPWDVREAALRAILGR